MAITSAWKYSCALTIDRTKVGADLTNFPTLVCWTGTQSTSNVPAGIFSGAYAAQAAGGDIRFTSDSDGATELCFEIVSFSSTSAEIWVKLASVSSSVNTLFYIWWGNAAASAYAVNATYGRDNVWLEFSSVWHCSALTDSKAAYGNMTMTGTLAAAAGVFGVAATAYQSNGSTNYAVTTAIYAAASTTQSTYYSVWIKSPTFSADWQFACGSHQAGLQRSSSNNYFAFALNS